MFLAIIETVVYAVSSRLTFVFSILEYIDYLILNSAFISSHFEHLKL